MSNLMEKLAISKKIMDKHNEVPRSGMSGDLPMNDNVNATYNIPDSVMEQTQQPIKQPINNTVQMNQPVSEDAIKNSKLPDEIKKLMMENPISQPQMGGPILSDELIEGATRLMGTSKNPINETQRPNHTTQTKTSNSDLKQMIRDVVRDTVRDVIKEELQSAGLISESSQKTNETLSLRVGKHVFEGKVLKIKKVKQ